jgi:uncharacterized 2Fe-2S/4Fe-4S cluster protein (DUF4445 family)
MSKFFEIFFYPFKARGKVRAGSLVSEAAQILDIPLRSDCGGKGTCGKCIIMADPPENLTPASPAEKKILSKSSAAGSARLACQAKITGPVTITIPENLIIHDESSGKTSVTACFTPEHGKRRKKGLGLAFDIGTTTIAAYLCSLDSGRILVSQAMVNPQRRFGEDVISRIAAVRENPENLKKQQNLVTGAMNELTKLCLEKTKNTISEIKEITAVGNTTMEHILAGINPENLGVAPYKPVTHAAVRTESSKLGLNLEPGTPVYIFPVISGFLGGDILGAFLADQPFRGEKTSLIIDIGTNGELILYTEQGIWATSCATGPALEGAQISCGMRASSGAISQVFFNPESENPICFKTIGNTEPAGICGSGMIDALAAMRKAGITLENGMFNTKALGVICDKTGIGRKYRFPETDLHITLSDVRQVQLAKAALFTGIELLLEKAGIRKVDRTVLTGAFGAKFNWQNARDIGMLPSSVLKGQVETQQNLAGAGAVMALVSPSSRIKIQDIAPEVKFIDLSCEPDFTTRFSNATRFP